MLMKAVVPMPDCDTLLLAACGIARHPQVLTYALPWCKTVVVQDEAMDMRNDMPGMSPVRAHLAAGFLWNFIENVPEGITDIHFHVVMDRNTWCRVLHLSAAMYMDNWERLLRTRVYLTGNVTDMEHITKEFESELRDLAAAAGLQISVLCPGKVEKFFGMWLPQVLGGVDVCMQSVVWACIVSYVADFVLLLRNNEALRATP